MSMSWMRLRSSSGSFAISGLPPSSTPRFSDTTSSCRSSYHSRPKQQESLIVILNTTTITSRAQTVLIQLIDTMKSSVSEVEGIKQVEEMKNYLRGICIDVENLTRI